MAENGLDQRLRTAARELDARAPAFDVGLLRSAPRPRVRGRVVALVCAAALAGMAVAPASVSAIRHLFDVDEVPALGPLEPGVAPPYAGRTVPVEEVQASTPFRVRTISALGAPDEARVRDDIVGGMTTIVYGGGRILLTQWRTTDVHPRIAIVPVSGSADDVTIEGRPALWIEGAARGTFTLVGADGTIHRESFEAGPGVLLWQQDEMTLLLQGAGPEADAIRLAAEVDP